VNHVATFTGNGVDETRLYAGKPAYLVGTRLFPRGEEGDRQ